MVWPSVQWIILISEMLVPYLHFVVVATLFVLAGISLSTSLITIPLLLDCNNPHYPPSSSSTNNTTTTTVSYLLVAVTAHTTRFSRRIERLLLGTLVFLSFFSIRHSDAVVHWRLPYHLATLAALAPVLAFDYRFLGPVEAALDALHPEVGVESSRELKPLARRWDAEGLLDRWARLWMVRSGFPLLAGAVSLAGFIGR